MNHKSHYNKLINNSQNRILDNNEYYEKHHILPRCLGGTDGTNNLTYLTLREHFVAHLLLTKIYPHGQIFYAFRMMCNRTKCNSHKYTSLRIKARKWISQKLKGRKLSQKHRDNITKYVRNMPQSHRDSLSKALTGRKLSDTHKQNIGKSNKNKVRTDEYKEKHSKIFKQKIRSGEYFPNISGFKTRKKGEFKHSDTSKQKMSLNRQGKTYEEIFGEERAQIYRDLKRQQFLGANNPIYKEYNHPLALSLLLEGKTNKTIAETLNISVPTHINKFKKIYGTTPRKYKEKYDHDVHNK